MLAAVMNRLIIMLLFVTLLAPAAFSERMLPQGGMDFNSAQIISPDLYVTGRTINPNHYEYFMLTVPANQSLTIQMASCGKGTSSVAVYSYKKQKMAEATIGESNPSETKTLQVKSDIQTIYYIRVGGNVATCDKTKLNIAINYEGVTFLPDEPIVVMPGIPSTK